MGFQQVPVQGRYVLLRPPIHQKDPEPGDLLPVGFLRGEGRKQVNPNSYPTPQAHNLGGGPGYMGIRRHNPVVLATTRRNELLPSQAQHCLGPG